MNNMEHDNEREDKEVEDEEVGELDQESEEDIVDDDFSSSGSEGIKMSESSSGSELQCSGSETGAIRILRNEEMIGASSSRMQLSEEPSSFVDGLKGLPVPTNLSTPIIGEADIYLVWSFGHHQRRSFLVFVVERSTDAFFFSAVGRTTECMFVDKGLDHSTAYYYRIKAEDNSMRSVSDPSPVKKVTTLEKLPTFNGLPEPTIPSNVQGVATEEGIFLSWECDANTEGFRINRSIDGIDWTEIACLETSARQHMDQTIDWTTSPVYYYWVASFNGDKFCPITFVLDVWKPLQLQAVGLP